MKKILIVISCFLLLGCGSLTNTTAKKQENKQYQKAITTGKLLVQNDWLREADSFTFYKDSGNTNYAVQVWPKGAFTYSPEDGFAGEASSIVITGSDQQTLNKGQLAHSYEEDKGKKNAEIKITDEQRTNEKGSITTHSVSWKWIITIGVMLFLTGLLLFKQFKQIAS